MQASMRINPINLDDYPVEVTYEILSFVPVESAFQCKQVSRTWRDFFDHIKEGMIFAIGLNNKEKPCYRLYYAASDMIMNNIKQGHTYAHLLAEYHHPSIENRYHSDPYENYKDVIVGSCNGLVCFTIPNNVIDDPVYICNPFTRESVNLPRLLATAISQDGLVVSGFGFDLHNEQYKVVRIYYPDKNIDVGHVQVYTLGGGSGWRNVGDITYSLCSTAGILVDGVLHWIDYKAMKILGLSLKDEKFHLLPLPPCLNLCEAADLRLRKLRGRLCVVHHRREYNFIDIWFYTKDSSYDRSWSLEVKLNTITKNITLDDYPFLVTEKNEILYWYNKSDLICFDPETSATKLVIRDSSSLSLKYFSATPHINTRVSLKTLEKEKCVVKEWDGSNGELYDQPEPPGDAQLIKTALSDLAVQYWEAARWVYPWILKIVLCVCFVYAGWLVLGGYHIGINYEKLATFLFTALFCIAVEIVAFFVLEEYIYREI